MGAHLHRGLREGALILIGTLAVYLLIALFSYSPNDPGWSHSGMSDRVANMGGRVGAWFSDVFFYLFGMMAYLLPFMVAYGAWILYREKLDEEVDGSQALHLALRGLGFVVTMATGAALAYLTSSTRRRCLSTVAVFSAIRDLLVPMPRQVLRSPPTPRM